MYPNIIVTMSYSFTFKIKISLSYCDDYNYLWSQYLCCDR